MGYVLQLLGYIYIYIHITMVYECILYYIHLNTVGIEPICAAQKHGLYNHKKTYVLNDVLNIYIYMGISE